MGTIKNIFTEHGLSYLDKYGNKMPANHRKAIARASFHDNFYRP